MKMAKPKLLIDIDGPLNPYNMRDCPEGYTEKLLTEGRDGLRWATRVKPSEFHYRVRLNPAHGPMLLALEDVVELTWATMWEHNANALYGPEIGLPQLPVIEFPKYRTQASGHIPKFKDVCAYVGDESFAWFDDDFEPGDLEWAAKRSEGGIPTLLVPVDPAIGLRQGDVDLVAQWAAR